MSSMTFYAEMWPGRRWNASADHSVWWRLDAGTGSVTGELRCHAALEAPCRNDDRGCQVAGMTAELTYGGADAAPVHDGPVEIERTDSVDWQWHYLHPEDGLHIDLPPVPEQAERAYAALTRDELVNVARSTYQHLEAWCRSMDPHIIRQLARSTMAGPILWNSPGYRAATAEAQPTRRNHPVSYNDAVDVHAMFAAERNSGGAA